MTVLQRGAVQAPALPKETVHVASLGGDVIVRGLLLSERLANAANHTQLSKPQPGETEDQARVRAGMGGVPRTLARCVVLADGQPMWTERQWEEFGSTQQAEALALFSVAMRLNGLDLEAAEKN